MRCFDFLFVCSCLSNIFGFFYGWNVFLYCWCVLYYKLLFLMRLSDSLSFSVYMNIFQRYFRTFFEHFMNKCLRSVNNSRTKDSLWFFRFGRIFKDLWGPIWSPPPPPSPASMSKSPPGGKKYGKKHLVRTLWFLWKNWKMVLKWY